MPPPLLLATVDEQGATGAEAAASVALLMADAGALAVDQARRPGTRSTVCSWRGGSPTRLSSDSVRCSPKTSAYRVRAVPEMLARIRDTAARTTS